MFFPASKGYRSVAHDRREQGRARFVAVVTENEVMAHRGGDAQVIELGGRTVIPGLIDSHMHPIRGGFN